MNLICINNSYSKDQLEVFAKHNIKYPNLDEIVEFLRFVKYTENNKKGIIVSPYDNQFIKGFHHGTEVLVEVSFNYQRFATLEGIPLSIEMIKELKKELV